MKYDEFVGQVRSRANLETGEQARKAIQATLESLGERLAGNEANQLAAQLPQELTGYLQTIDANESESFSLEEFFRRVSLREGVAEPEASLHARVIIALISESVSMGEVQDIRAQLPADFAQLFAVENTGELPDMQR